MFKSSLFDETTFYSQFTKDLLRCTSEVVIECPYITTQRMRTLYPVFETLVRRNVKVYLITRDPREHQESMEPQAEVVIQQFESLGVQVFLCLGNDHRKLAILDRKILWEGSLNILSHVYSREIMRRIEGMEYANEMFNFLNLGRFI